MCFNSLRSDDTFNWVVIGSDNNLSPVRCKAIIRTNAALSSIWPLVKYQWNFNKNTNVLLNKRGLEISSAKWRPCCFGPNVLLADKAHCFPSFIPGYHVQDGEKFLSKVPSGPGILETSFNYNSYVPGQENSVNLKILFNPSSEMW